MRDSVKKAIASAICFFLVLFCLEVWARSYYAIKRHISFFASPDDIAYTWYPELKRADDYRYMPSRINILLLGGSTLTRDWGSVEPLIRRQARKILGRRANILNLAASSHGTPDSLHKYQFIRDRHFDFVIVYHCINETRANNVPREIFKKDYSHYAWYEEINFYFRHSYLCKTPFIFPYFLRHLVVQLKKEILCKDCYVPENSPRKGWLRFGKDIKSEETFRNNLIRIIDLAQARHEPLIIPTFAYYKTAVSTGTGEPNMEFTKIWGRFENVKAGIEAHDVVIRRLAENKNFIFVDMERLMDNDKSYFKDICHFTARGSRFFADNVVEKMKR